jgi:hypothetical protein
MPTCVRRRGAAAQRDETVSRLMEDKIDLKLLEEKMLREFADVLLGGYEVVFGSEVLLLFDDESLKLEKFRAA